MIAQPELIQDEVAFLAAQVPLERADVIELGCGAAAFSRKLLQQFPGARVTALEVDEDAHQDNLRRGGERLQFVLAGSQSIPFDDASFDVAIMLKSLHHVPTPMIGLALRETHRVLRRGGYLYVSEPVYAGPFNDLIKMFNDERVVRAAAQAAISESVGQGLWDVMLDGGYNAPMTYRDWPDFRSKHLEASYRESTVPPALVEQVRVAFEPHMTPQGARFERPLQIHLLKKR